jgi:hypothetical protein
MQPNNFLLFNTRKLEVYTVVKVLMLFLVVTLCRVFRFEDSSIPNKNKVTVNRLSFMLQQLHNNHFMRFCVTSNFRE